MGVVMKISIRSMHELLLHVQQEHPNVACGMLFGAGDAVERVWPAKNKHEQPSRRYLVDPSDMLAAVRWLEKQGQSWHESLIGFYESWRYAPSASSVQMDWWTNYPDATRLIVSMKDPGQLRYNAFRSVSAEGNPSKREMIEVTIEPFDDGIGSFRSVEAMLRDIAASAPQPTSPRQPRMREELRSRQQPCRLCGGGGLVGCPTCRGAGYVKGEFIQEPDWQGSYSEYTPRTVPSSAGSYKAEPCPTCGGRNVYGGCMTCFGSGYIKKEYSKRCRTCGGARGGFCPHCGGTGRD